MSVGRITKALLAVVIFVMGYALLDDLLNGLPFTRSASSWPTWAVGLFFFGLVGVVIEGAFEWVFGPDDPWRRGPRRIIRVSYAALAATIVVAVIAALTRFHK